jgi:hypothetical protein
MNPSFKIIQLFFLLATPIAKVVAFAENEVFVDVNPSMIRGGNLGMEESSAHGRELYASGSWSWSNLLCEFNCSNIIFLEFR